MTSLHEICGLGPLQSKILATPMQEVMHLGEEETFTASKVAIEIKGIKSENAADESEIKAEMLKALTIEKELSG